MAKGSKKKTDEENEPIPEPEYTGPLSKCCDAPIGTLRTCTECGKRA